MNTKHTPGPWSMSGPMGTDHLHGREPWFWVSAENTLHLKVVACADGYVIGQNEANARLIAAAPELLASLVELTNMCGRQADFNDDGDGRMFDRCFAAITKAVGPA